MAASVFRPQEHVVLVQRIRLPVERQVAAERVQVVVRVLAVDFTSNETTTILFIHSHHM